jgi:hypothetical protein
MPLINCACAVVHEPHHLKKQNKHNAEFTSITRKADSLARRNPKKEQCGDWHRSSIHHVDHHMF